MMIKQFVINGYESNCFVVTCPESGETLVVDPGNDQEDILEYIAGESRKVRSIFITHAHYDHVGGVETILQRCGCEVLSGEGATGGAAGRQVADGEEITLGTLTGTCIHVPGHTSDSFCLRLGSAVFTGDALFAGSIGGTPSENEKNRLMRGLKEKVFSLGDDTVLYPGHGPRSSVRIESMASPFFAPGLRVKS
jgi:glyoxylase-like metal-dependent hydrolase (beta-lactamase superfamily II)